MAVMVSAVLIDLWTGVRAAKARGEKIKSRILRRTITKVGDYWRVQAFGLIVDALLVFFFDHPYATMVVTLGEVLIEYRSVTENLRSCHSRAGGVTEAAGEVLETIISRGERGIMNKTAAPVKEEKGEGGQDE